MVAPVFGMLMKGGENMEILYYSQTGNVRRFIEKLQTEIQMDCISILDKSTTKEEYILITPTTGFGQVPDPVAVFLQENHMYLKGVIGSGNMNWGENYCGAARTVSTTYGVPLIHTFELHGTPNDLKLVKGRVEEIESSRIKQ